MTLKEISELRSLLKVNIKNNVISVEGLINYLEGSYDAANENSLILALHYRMEKIIFDHCA